MNSTIVFQLTYVLRQQHVRQSRLATDQKFETLRAIQPSLQCTVRHGATIVQSVLRLAKGWKVQRLKPGGGQIFCTRPERPWGAHSLLYDGYRVFPRGKAAGAWR
jgi:hypothetical protein